jgi:hypothetical protein
MNSKQRRKDKKRWKYHVTVKFPNNLSNWAEEGEFYLKMFNWCKENYGDNVERCGWRERKFGDLWEFDCPKKATAFALKWAS